MVAIFEGPIGRRRAVAIVVLGLLLAPVPAHAGSPPETFLRSDGERLQRGVQGSSCWGDLCSEVFNKYPASVSVDSGAKVRIRVRKARKPAELNISYYRRVDKRGQGRGEAQPIEYRLRGVRRDGDIVAWDAIFGTTGTHHFYVDVFGRWGGNDSSWKFHFKTE